MQTCRWRLGILLIGDTTHTQHHQSSIIDYSAAPVGVLVVVGSVVHEVGEGGVVLGRGDGRRPRHRLLAVDAPENLKFGSDFLSFKGSFKFGRMVECKIFS